MDSAAIAREVTLELDLRPPLTAHIVRWVCSTYVNDVGRSMLNDRYGDRMAPSIESLILQVMGD